MGFSRLHSINVKTGCPAVSNAPKVKVAAAKKPQGSQTTGPLQMFQVDAFTSKLFSGNPAAVVPLTAWLPDGVLQDIAAENNLAETAYILPHEDDLSFHIRWFTPTQEVDLCGHATLASAHVLFEHLGVDGDQLRFHSNSGVLPVSRKDGMLELNFPALPCSKVSSSEVKDALQASLGVKGRLDVYDSIYDYMVQVDDEEVVKGIYPDFLELSSLEKRGVMVTSKGKHVDFVSRFFAPAAGIDEDPVTGSAHSVLAPFWAAQLGKNTLKARQVSKRGGDVLCTVKGDRVLISGQAVTYMEGKIFE